jgi:hypothetical protein
MRSYPSGQRGPSLPPPGISSCTSSLSVGKRRGKGGKVIRKARKSRGGRQDHVAIKILTAIAMHARLTYGESRSPVRWCPTQGEYMSAFLFDKHDVSRTTELTYPRTLEEDPQESGFDQQLRDPCSYLPTPERFLEYRYRCRSRAAIRGGAIES